MQIEFKEELNYYRRVNIPSGDLRISIIAECNLRCRYCHNEGQGAFSSSILTIENVKRIVMLGKNFGVYKIRLTGGEPLIHPDIIQMIYMIKNDLHIDNVGINTNGLLLNEKMIIQLLEAGLNTIVVGLDFFSSPVSKDGLCGKSPQDLLYKIKRAHNLGLKTQIACVYNMSNYKEIFELVKWCIKNSILIKIIEICCAEITAKTSSEYESLVHEIIERFKLQVGKTVSLNEYYGIHPSGNKVLFFHSKCRIRECYECVQMHMRVTAEGKAKPCILRKDTEFDLLSINSFEEMLKAIHNLGNPPERPIR